MDQNQNEMSLSENVEEFGVLDPNINQIMSQKRDSLPINQKVNSQKSDENKTLRPNSVQMNIPYSEALPTLDPKEIPVADADMTLNNLKENDRIISKMDNFESSPKSRSRSASQKLQSGKKSKLSNRNVHNAATFECEKKTQQIQRQEQRSNILIRKYQSPSVTIQKQNFNAALAKSQNYYTTEVLKFLDPKDSLAMKIQNYHQDPKNELSQNEWQQIMAIFQNKHMYAIKYRGQSSGSISQKLENIRSASKDQRQKIVLNPIQHKQKSQNISLSRFGDLVSSRPDHKQQSIQPEIIGLPKINQKPKKLKLDKQDVLIQMSPYTHAVPIKGEKDPEIVASSRNQGWRSRKRSRKSTVVSKLQEGYNLKNQKKSFCLEDVPKIMNGNLEQVLGRNEKYSQHTEMTPVPRERRRQDRSLNKLIKDGQQQRTKFESETYQLIQNMLSQPNQQTSLSNLPKPRPQPNYLKQLQTSPQPPRNPNHKPNEQRQMSKMLNRHLVLTPPNIQKITKIKKQVSPMYKTQQGQAFPHFNQPKSDHKRANFMQTKSIQPLAPPTPTVATPAPEQNHPKQISKTSISDSAKQSDPDPVHASKPTQKPPTQQKVKKKIIVTQSQQKFDQIMSFNNNINQQLLDLDNNIYKLKRIEKKKDRLAKYQNIITNRQDKNGKLADWEIEQLKEKTNRMGAPKMVKFVD